MDKVLFSVITLFVITILIIGMCLDKSKRANNILNREVENFSNQEKQRDIDKENELENTYQLFQYEPYRKQEGFGSVIEGLDIGKQIARALMKPFQPLIDFFEKVKRAFEQIPVRVNAFNTAFKWVGEGIKLEFVNLGKGLELGFDDLFDVVKTFGTCGITFFTNLRTCILWYMLDWIGKTIYAILVEFPVYMIKLFTSIDLQYIVDMINCLLEELDGLCFKYLCFHCFHFPQWVINSCYSCQLKEKATKMDFDWNVTIPNLLNEPAIDFHKAKNYFNATFSENPDKVDEPNNDTK